MSALLNLAIFIAGHPLTRDRKLRAFARLISWQVQSRLQPEVVVPWIEGTRLAARRGMTGATGNIYCGLHEFQDMAFLLHFLRPGDVFADIGANIGSYTVLASGVRRARTIAFEPDPVTFAALSRNVGLNSLADLVKCRNCALGSKIGQIEFTVGLDTTNRVAAETDNRTQTVRLDTLDHALQGEALNLLKVDVEGFECEVVRGAASTLSTPELKAVITEDRSSFVTASLQETGFIECYYDPLTRKLATEPPQYRSHNALFVRDRDFVQQRLTGAAPVRIFSKWL
jgi:FkbM family methyltransferase